MTTIWAPSDARSRPHVGGATRPGALRVLHVLPSLFGGGMERATLRLIQGSCDSDLSTTNHAQVPFLAHGLCILKDADAAFMAQCRSRARIWALSDGSGRAARLSSWWRLRHVVRQFRPHVVHARSTGVWADAALATRGLRGVKLLLSFHGKTQVDGPGLKRRLLNRWAAARADAVLTVSDESADYLRRAWGVPERKLTVLRNGVDIHRFRPPANPEEILHARAGLGLDPADRVVICVANFVPIKDIEVLIRAWPPILAAQPAARLLLVGDGPLRARLQNLAWNLGCRPSVLFAGARENTAELLRAADLFVLPSRYEACSNAILEAQAAGLPVIACAVGGNHELVTQGTTGWLVPPHSPEALAVQILNALSNASVLEPVGHAARRQAVTTHPESAWLAAYASLYASLAATPRHRTEADPCVE